MADAIETRYSSMYVSSHQISSLQLQVKPLRLGRGSQKFLGCWGSAPFGLERGYKYAFPLPVLPCQIRFQVKPFERNYGDLLEFYYHSRTAFQGHSRSLELTRIDRLIFTATGERLAKLWTNNNDNTVLKQFRSKVSEALIAIRAIQAFFSTLLYNYCTCCE